MVTKREKILIIFLILAVFLTLGLLIGFLIHIFIQDEQHEEKNYHTKPEYGEQIGSVSEKIKICTNPGCISSAALFLQSMNPSLDPCDDLYKFMCGKYSETHPVPDDEMAIDVFGQLNRKISEHVKALLEEQIQETDLISTKTAKEFYKLCLDTQRNNELGLEPLKKLLNSFQGWPLASEIPIEKDEINEFHVYRLIGLVNRIGLPTNLLNIQLLPDPINPIRNLITLDQPFDPVSRAKSYRPKKKLEWFERLNSDTFSLVKLIQGVAKILGNNEPYEFSPDILDVIHLSESLRKISTALRNRQNPLRLYNKKTLQDLNKFTNQTKMWQEILNVMFKGIKPITADEEIIVTSLNYIKELPIVLKKFSYKAITNYIIWEVILSLISFLPEDIETLHRNYVKETLEIQPDSRWKFCVQETIERDKYAVARMYIDEYANKGIKNFTEKLVRDHIIVYQDMINKSPWVHENTKKAAYKKSENIIIHVGFQDWILNDEMLTESYENETISYSLLQDVLDRKKQSSILSLQNYNETYDRYLWDSDVLEANAFYSPTDNSISFPIGILTRPFIDMDTLMAINYGAMGSTIGHEIGHAFDSSGRFYDYKGALRLWWDLESLKIYDNKKKCYIQQYGNFCPEELKEEENECVDANNTLAENIADDSGLKNSFMAYRKWVIENGEEKRLPGLEKYTPEQLFFLSHAYSNCENIKQGFYATVYNNEEHSPNYYRVVGVIDNFYDEFAKVFNCPVRKNESVSCNIW